MQIDQEKFKLPWTIDEDANPGCSKCQSEGVKGIEVKNCDGEVILHSGHETFFFFEQFDLAAIVAVMNETINDV